MAVGIVYVGKKSIPAYLTNVLAHLQAKNKVIIKARGKYIGKAIGIANILDKDTYDIKVEIGGEVVEKVIKDEQGNDVKKPVHTALITIIITKKESEKNV